jgi:septal ring factor EnvC (AmiA/AmiB activator)
MDKFDKRYKCVVRDDVLGNIIVWFDDLLQTKTFANRIKDELTRHLNNIDELAKKIDKANQFATEQQQRANTYNEKYTTECMAHESTRYALTVSQNRVMQLEEKIDELNGKINVATHYKTSVGDIPFIVKTVIRMYERGTSIDTIINKIVKKLEK